MGKTDDDNIKERAYHLASTLFCVLHHGQKI